MSREVIQGRRSPVPIHPLLLLHVTILGLALSASRSPGLAQGGETPEPSGARQVAPAATADSGSGRAVAEWDALRGLRRSEVRALLGHPDRIKYDNPPFLLHGGLGRYAQPGETWHYREVEWRGRRVQGLRVHFRGNGRVDRAFVEGSELQPDREER